MITCGVCGKRSRKGTEAHTPECTADLAERAVRAATFLSITRGSLLRSLTLDRCGARFDLSPAEVAQIVAVANRDQPAVIKISTLNLDTLMELTRHAAIEGVSGDTATAVKAEQALEDFHRKFAAIGNTGEE
jgi:hypothetical protein